MENSHSQNHISFAKSDYNTILVDFCRQDDQSICNMQLISFVVFYKVTDSRNRAQLLEKICNLRPSPHSIFHHEGGYLCRFELDITVPVDTAQQEQMLERAVRGFVGLDEELTGEFQYLEVGRWEHQSNQYLVNGGCSNG